MFRLQEPASREPACLSQLLAIFPGAGASPTLRRVSRRMQVLLFAEPWRSYTIAVGDSFVRTLGPLRDYILRRPAYHRLLSRGGRR